MYHVRVVDEVQAEREDELSDIELIQGDCLDVMRSMGDKSVDLCLTDPPYGIDHIHAGGRNNNGWTTNLYQGEWDKERPHKNYFDEILRVSKKIIIWGGNYFTDYLYPSMQWFIWDKGQRNFSLADFEMAWSSEKIASRIFNYPRAAALQDGKVHPTQKPIELMSWCIELAKVDNDAIIFDPFMGSGTTIVAGIKLGYKNFIGIEIDPTYFEIAQERIRVAQMQPNLFEVTP